MYTIENKTEAEKIENNTAEKIENSTAEKKEIFLPGSQKYADALEERYIEKGKSYYRIISTIEEDDDSEQEIHLIFKKPETSSYDRYVKTSANSPHKALKAFVEDNIVDEMEDYLDGIHDKYPAFSIGVGEKLLNILGYSKSITVKKLKK